MYLRPKPMPPSRVEQPERAQQEGRRGPIQVVRLRNAKQLESGSACRTSTSLPWALHSTNQGSRCSISDTVEQTSLIVFASEPPTCSFVISNVCSTLFVSTSNRLMQDGGPMQHLVGFDMSTKANAQSIDGIAESVTVSADNRRINDCSWRLNVFDPLADEVRFKSGLRRSGIEMWC